MTDQTDITATEREEWDRNVKLAHDRAILIEELKADINALRLLSDRNSLLPYFWQDWASRQIDRITATLREVGAS